ncbi:hypothetical protein GW17_00031088, partial [Ensete ventricosum]
SRRRRDKARERERMQRRRSTPAGISTLRWALTCAIGAIAVGALVAVHVFLLPSAAVPDAFKLPKASPPPPPPLFFFFWFPLLKGGLFTTSIYDPLPASMIRPDLVVVVVMFSNVRLDTGERLTSSAGPRKSRLPNSPSFGFPLRR